MNKESGKNEYWLISPRQNGDFPIKFKLIWQKEKVSKCSLKLISEVETTLCDETTKELLAASQIEMDPHLKGIFAKPQPLDDPLWLNGDLELFVEGLRLVWSQKPRYVAVWKKA